MQAHEVAKAVYEGRVLSLLVDHVDLQLGKDGMQRVECVLRIHTPGSADPRYVRVFPGQAVCWVPEGDEVLTIGGADG